MPRLCPVWIAEYIWATLFSRIRLRMAGVPIMISWAAMRPWPSLVLSSVCEITARSDSESIERTISFSAAGKTSMMRSMVLAAEAVCSVANTKWPVSEAVIARRMVSRSRISPTRITSGSCRNARRMASAKVGTSGRVALRLSPEIAMPFNLPALTCAMALARLCSTCAISARSWR